MALVLISGLIIVLADSQTDFKFMMVEIAIVQDATGSMSGLIEGARKKIRSIANNVVEFNLRPRTTYPLYVTTALPLSSRVVPDYNHPVAT